MTNRAGSLLRRGWWRLAAAATIGALLLACAGPAAAQKEKKKKKNEETGNTDSGKPMIPMGDEQQIDYMISDMLGAWQLGDVEKLHADYGDDVSVVSGIWTPPIIGWKSYLAVYQQQRARMQQVRLDRSNTYIKVNGSFGWACYQWDFSAVVDGQPSAAQGQTTLVVEKRNNRWVIVHNHTSLVTPQQAAPANTQPAAPSEAAKPPSS